LLSSSSRGLSDSGSPCDVALLTARSRAMLSKWSAWRLLELKVVVLVVTGRPAAAIAHYRAVPTERLSAFATPRRGALQGVGRGRLAEYREVVKWLADGNYRVAPLSVVRLACPSNWA